MQKSDKMLTVSVWFGYNKNVSLAREGIYRFFIYLITELIKDPNIRVEIWCYSYNYNEIRDTFATQLSSQLEIISDNDFIEGRVIDAKNYFADIRAKNTLREIWGQFKSSLKSYFLKYTTNNKKFILIDILILYATTLIFLSNLSRRLLKKITAKKTLWILFPLMILFISFLIYLISRYLVITSFLLALLGSLLIVFTIPALFLFYRNRSKSFILENAFNRRTDSDIAIVPIISLVNAVSLKVPKLVMAFDLFTFEFKKEFVEWDESFTEVIKETEVALDKFIANGAYFCSCSEHIRKSHFLNYSSNLEEDHTYVVHMPPIITVNKEESTPEEVSSTLQKYNIASKYIFYPTKIRPHKNFLVLLKAFEMIFNDLHDIKLVLTDSFRFFPELEKYVKNNNLLEKVAFALDVSESELPILYKNAEIIVVPTLAEADFPLQATEALSLDAPLIVSNIEVVKERLRFSNIDLDQIITFDPGNVEDLAKQIKYVYNNRNDVLNKQRIAKKKMEEYNWGEATKVYKNILYNIVNQQK